MSPEAHVDVVCLHFVFFGARLKHHVHLLHSELLGVVRIYVGGVCVCVGGYGVCVVCV